VLDALIASVSKSRPKAPYAPRAWHQSSTSGASAARKSSPPPVAPPRHGSLGPVEKGDAAAGRDALPPPLQLRMLGAITWRMTGLASETIPHFAGIRSSLRSSGLQHSCWGDAKKESPAVGDILPPTREGCRFFWGGWLLVSLCRPPKHVALNIQATPTLPPPLPALEVAGILLA
jgi:hypothetical protein